MITGVRFVACINHPDQVAREWRGEEPDRHPYCQGCMQPIYDAATVARIERDPAASAAVSALHAALKAGNDRKAGSARRALRDWTTPAGVRTVSRHLQRIIAAHADRTDESEG